MLDSVITVEGTGGRIILRGLGGIESAPLVLAFLQFDLLVGQGLEGAVLELPDAEADLILSNSIAGGKVHADRLVSETLVDSGETENKNSESLESKSKFLCVCFIRQ